MKFFKRPLIIALWIALIFGVLYFPRLPFIQQAEKSLNVFCWGDGIDPDVVADFERETGIKVHLNYFSSNEELLVKMQATGGEGYDLIGPSDYAVGYLIRDGLLKPLDKNKLPFFDRLNPLLLNLAFDPDNTYSIPFEWEVFGLGIDTEYFEKRPFTPSWRQIFDPTVIDYKIAMINDAPEAVLIANLYLYDNDSYIGEKQFEAIGRLLKEQSQWVEAYADFRANYFLATRNCPVVVATSPYIWRTKDQFPFIKFVLPKEGSYISIENFCIPAKSRKEKLAYQFLNYLYTKDSFERHFAEYGFFPAMRGVVDALEEDEDAQALMLDGPDAAKKFRFFKDLVPQSKVRQLWIEVKSF